MGLQYAGGDESVYQIILEGYGEQGDEYLVTLPQAYEDECWADYGVIAHAIKNNAMTLGAVQFSERAKKHEFAGKEENIAFIREDWNGFLAEYKATIEYAKKEAQETM